MTRGMGRLILAFVVALAGWLGIVGPGTVRRPHPARQAIVAALDRTTGAFAVVDSIKRAENVPFPADSSVRWRALLGQDYTPMTTTLGSLAAKEVATNPAWAGVVARSLIDTGVAVGDTVGVMASGSFPSLALATIAAVEAIGAEPLVMVSLGASSYGANVREATLLDILRWARESGMIRSTPELVTTGGEEDCGRDLDEEGHAWMRAAAQRNGCRLEVAPSLAEAVSRRTARLRRAAPGAVVNIGGSQVALGSCAHAPVLPVGAWSGAPRCECPEGGVLVRLAREGVSIMHLLDIRSLAARYGLDYEPGGGYADAGDLAEIREPRRAGVMLALTAVVLVLTVPGRKTP
jgi:poly-gamma-glutamate system protein